MVYKNEVSRLYLTINNLEKKLYQQQQEGNQQEEGQQEGNKKEEDDDNYYNIYTLSFFNTLRNCLGKYCFDQRPVGYTYDTVGLLAPPRSGGEEIMSTIINSGGNVKSSDVYLEYDTHVPAYGYGKNHGWSRIIRLVR